MKAHSREAVNFVLEEARAAIRRMCAGGKLDALFVANDSVAFGVMDTLRYERQLRVPHDFSFVGYDDTPTAAWPACDPTTAQQPANRMIESTVEILPGQIEGDGSTRTISMDGPLILRGSARIPDGGNR